MGLVRYCPRMRFFCSGTMARRLAVFGWCGTSACGGPPAEATRVAGAALRPNDSLTARLARSQAQGNLAAIGCGASPDVAEAAARAELSKVFQVDVDAETRADEFETVQRAGASQTADSWSHVSQSLQERTRKELFGAAIVDVFAQDEQTCAVAALDREQTASDLRRRVREIDAAIRDDLIGADSARRPIEQVGPPPVSG